VPEFPELGGPEFTEPTARCGFRKLWHAQVEFHPAMNLEDLKKATPGIEKAVKKYYSAARPKAA
jgi:hypothetical protein